MSTAVLPDGWRNRLVLVESKDTLFADALLRAGLVRPDAVAGRIELLVDVHPLVMKRLRDWIAAYLPKPDIG
ncbi:hypothetical protein [Salinispora oceanensis]|uniref:hypothetical protein n=1 Tax=Salinispora oceanensis TaxID=1050199 RepID=UPI0003AAE18E|nr:hypothetical protein [Salinispora oceanensis]